MQTLNNSETWLQNRTKINDNFTEIVDINGLVEKTNPINADMIQIMDSGAGNILKKLSWINIKATLKTYFDTLYSI
jgi:hypothetical protein